MTVSIDNKTATPQHDEIVTPQHDEIVCSFTSRIKSVNCVECKLLHCEYRASRGVDYQTMPLVQYVSRTFPTKSKRHWNAGARDLLLDDEILLVNREATQLDYTIRLVTERRQGFTRQKRRVNSFVLEC